MAFPLQHEHPHPGMPYHGTKRVAYLPNNHEGQKVCALLRRAFNARLTFTIGQSSTTGKDDQVIWNDIHHKTQLSGGMMWYVYLYKINSVTASIHLDSNTREIHFSVRKSFLKIIDLFRLEYGLPA